MALSDPLCDVLKVKKEFSSFVFMYFSVSIFSHRAGVCVRDYAHVLLRVHGFKGFLHVGLNLPHTQGQVVWGYPQLPAPWCLPSAETPPGLLTASTGKWNSWNILQLKYARNSLGGGCFYSWVRVSPSPTLPTKPNFKCNHEMHLRAFPAALFVSNSQAASLKDTQKGWGGWHGQLCSWLKGCSTHTLHSRPFGNQQRQPWVPPAPRPWATY